MDERVLRCKTHEDCLTFAKNATERGHPELAQQARIYSLRLRANEHKPTSDIERDGLEALYAYEDALTEKNGRTTRATRTREMIENHGLIGAIERAVNRPDDPEGFTLLIDMGLSEFTFEQIVLRYRDQFSREAVQQATARVSR